jgi:DNA invertase Pin-like site-specific DNA recombinase
MTIYLGYCRVSTLDQSLDLQIAVLKPLCGDLLWQEKASGMKAGRTALAAIVEEARRLRASGESVTIVCYSLSRLGRRMLETIALIEDLRAAEIGFRSITEQFDTSTPLGRAFLAIVAALAQAEAETLAERTRAGLAARKAAGVKLGRPKLRDYDCAVEKAKALIAAGSTVYSAAKQVGMPPSSLLRRLNVA